MIRRFVIFGASGDLTARYLLPAFAQLHAAGSLPGGLAIIGVARETWDTTTFRRHIAARLERASPRCCPRLPPGGDRYADILPG